VYRGVLKALRAGCAAIELAIVAGGRWEEWIMEDASLGQRLMAEGGRSAMPTYAPQLVLAKGRGARVWDVDGNAYLDFLAGIAVNVLGHCHPVYVERVQAQVATLLQVSNIFYSRPQIELATRLTELTFADRVFFCNSGAEANEAAIKLARRYQRTVRGSDRYEIVAMQGSFHGRTMGALSATGQPKYQAGFEPLVPGFRYAAFNQLDAVAAQVNRRTAAIIVEPIQGEGGVIPGHPSFLKELRDLCDACGALLIFDEVQTGMGRTGTLFHYEQLGFAPDILTTAKGLAGGLPMGAMLCRDEVARGFVKGSHATTFGGNPVVTAAGLAVLEVIEAEDLLGRCRRAGVRLRAGLEQLAGRHERLGEVRGAGLMLGVECSGDLGAVMAASREAGLLHNTAGGRVLRFLPPLVLSEEEVDEGLERLETALLRTAGVT
jgi:predicted acetylornithine/succinylornithine family transaminase